MDKLNANSNASVAQGSINRVSADRPRLNSDTLLGGAREVIIEHAGDEYRLRLTSQGKLILTK